MALIFTGSTECAICKKVLQDGEAIATLPAIANTQHPLYSFFDGGFHQSCFDNWEHKATIQQIIEEERAAYENSDYYKEMVAKYGEPKYKNTTPDK